MIKTYSVSTVSFWLIHSGWRLSALNVRSGSNSVISAKFTLWIGVKKTHVFEWTTSDKNSGGSSVGSTFWLDRVDVETEWLYSVLLFELCFDSLLLLGEGKDRGPALWSVTFIDGRGLIIVVLYDFSQDVVFRVFRGLRVTL